jgi:hypothetical protein
MPGHTDDKNAVPTADRGAALWFGAFIKPTSKPAGYLKQTGDERLVRDKFYYRNKTVSRIAFMLTTIGIWAVTVKMRRKSLRRGAIIVTISS